MAGGIAVFGSSEPRPGQPLYRQAYDVGRLLGEAGLTVVTGGYGGVMEAASRGAVEAGGQALGVSCRIFEGRSPNPYLTETIETPDLHIRTRELIERADGFLILEGKAGTLAELAFLWALERSGCLDSRPVILLGERWRGIVDGLAAGGLLEPAQLEATCLTQSPEAAISEMCARLPGPDAESGQGSDR